MAKKNAVKRNRGIVIPGVADDKLVSPRLLEKRNNRILRTAQKKMAEKTITRVPYFHIPGYKNFLYLESHRLITSKPKENEQMLYVREAKESELNDTK